MIVTRTQQIVALQTGQAIMFAPNALTVRNRPAAVSGWGPETEAGQPRTEGTVLPIGQGYFFVRSRYRVTRDGGHSLLAVDDPAATTRLGRVSGKKGMEPASGHGDAMRAWDASEIVHPTPTVAVLPPSYSQASMQPPPGLVRANPQSPQIIPSVPPIPLNSTTASHIEPFSQPITSTSIQSPQSIPTEATTITLAGDLYRFTPIVQYMQMVRGSGGKPSIPIATVQRRVPGRAPGMYNNPNALAADIENAISRGVIARTSSKKIQLIPGAHYVFGAAQPVVSQLSAFSSETIAAAVPYPSGDVIGSDARVYMAGAKQRFWPLVTYMQRSGGGAQISMKTIRKHFRKEEPTVYGQKPTVINEVISNAVKQGVLLRIDDKTVSLFPGVEYVN